MQKPDWWKPYTDKKLEEMVTRLVADLGECVEVVAPGGKYLIPRHFIAQHGIKGKDVAALSAQWGFKKLT